MNLRRLIEPPEECLIGASSLAPCDGATSEKGQPIDPDACDPMSEMGQTRKSGDAITTSALPPTADTPESGCDVRKVPEAVVIGAFGHGVESLLRRREGLCVPSSSATATSTPQRGR